MWERATARLSTTRVLLFVVVQRGVFEEAGDEGDGLVVAKHRLPDFSR